MRKIVTGILRQYGSSMTLERSSGTVTVKGFLQPVRSKSLQNLVHATTPLGEILRGQYVYIGPADMEVNPGDVLTVGGCSYILRRVEPYRYENEKIYIWGLCIEKGVNETWGSQS